MVTDISSLPVDVLLMLDLQSVPIFSRSIFNRIKDGVVKASRGKTFVVYCQKEWDELVARDGTWRYIGREDVLDVKASGVVSMSKSSPVNLKNLRSLNMPSYGDSHCNSPITPSLLTPSHLPSSLIELTLLGNHSYRSSINEAFVCEALPNLKSMLVDHSYWNAMHFSNLTKLTELTIDLSTRVSSTAPCSLLKLSVGYSLGSVAHIRGLTRLTHLSMYLQLFPDGHIRGLIEQFGCAASLKELKLDMLCSKIPDDFDNLLTTLPSLSELNVRFKELHYMKRRKDRFTLQGADIGDAFSALSSLTRLRLDIDETTVYPNFVTALAHLKQIDIVGCKFPEYERRIALRV
jgi:hypothetical protein